MKKLRDFIAGLNRREVFIYALFLLIASTVFIGLTFFHDTFEKVGYTLLFIELALLITAAWALAGHAVMKSLFLVGASLSLILFLAQSYCDASNLTQSGNDALKTLIAFGLIYVAVEFLRSLYKEVTDRTKTLKQINDGKKPWIFLIPFAIFVGVFVWQIVQVVLPALESLCVYK